MKPKNQAKPTKVTKDMTIGEVSRLYPKSAEIMVEYGLHCAGCFASAFDTIGDAMKIHGLSKKDLNEMVKRINQAI